MEPGARQPATVAIARRSSSHYGPRFLNNSSAVSLRQPPVHSRIHRLDAATRRTGTRAGWQAGRGYSAIERPRHCLTTELASQFVQERNLDGQSDSFLAGRAAEPYRYTVGGNTYVEERLEDLPIFETTEEYRLTGEGSLLTRLSRHLALKLG